MSFFVKTLKSELWNIRLAYIKALKNEYPDTFSEWLTDNYHILAREGGNIITASRNYKFLPETGGKPRIYPLALRVCGNGVLPSEEELEREIKNGKLTVIEIQLLEPMLKCALIYYAAEECRGFNKGRKAAAARGGNNCINAIKSFRRIQDIDFESLFARVSEVEGLLCRDLAGVYPNMDDGTKMVYRRRVSELARTRGTAEADVVRDALARSENAGSDREKHIGFYLSLNRNEKTRRGTTLLCFEAAFPLVIAVSVSILLRHWYL
ncbi:MAG: hypothetical protein FWF08_09310, partial [Oscillospiraceae bacterium]|nr:hypothetical protein [Oscillospiraceae bacterium]